MPFVFRRNNLGREEYETIQLYCKVYASAGSAERGRGLLRDGGEGRAFELAFERSGALGTFVVPLPGRTVGAVYRPTVIRNRDGRAFAVDREPLTGPAESADRFGELHAFIDPVRTIPIS